MKRVWCEWDIGQERLIFSTEDAAIRWLHNNDTLHAMAADEDSACFESYFQRLIDDCYVGLESVELIE